jgi:hypothetical protein
MNMRTNTCSQTYGHKHMKTRTNEYTTTTWYKNQTPVPSLDAPRVPETTLRARP